MVCLWIWQNKEMRLYVKSFYIYRLKQIREGYFDFGVLGEDIEKDK
jgi:hypothetical protein